MAVATTVTCTADAWKKVATDVFYGQIGFDTDPEIMYYTQYVLTGGAAPSGLAAAKPVPSPINGTSITLPISHDAAIDVYVYCVGSAGVVTVEV